MTEERWPRETYLSVGAILNYWFDGDKRKIQEHSTALRNACMVGQVQCVANCENGEQESVGTLFDRGGHDLLIERKSFEDWMNGSERIVRDPNKLTHWFDQIFIDREINIQEREKQEKEAQTRSEEEKKQREREEYREKIMIETEAKLQAESEFKRKSNKINAACSKEYNNTMKLVGALYEIFVEKTYGEVKIDQKQQLIDFILEKYPKVYGLKERALHDRIKKARRLITSEKD